MKKLTSAFFVLLGLLCAPFSAFAADTIKLDGKDTWDFYAYGNGEALAQILTAVKLMIAPDHGGGGFRYLLMFLAIVGFIVLAVRAGFDPGKNFLKMFGFIFLIWAVMYGTTGARANVHVYDRMSGYSNVIAGVPAIVALPASIVSQTGEWLTEQVEQNFSIPNSLKVSGSGQYSLFTKVMSDMNKFVITDMDLSSSLKAYVGDCVVPAMALGKVNASDFARKEKLVDVLETAALKPIMTRYYPMQAAAGSSCLHVPGNHKGGLGALMSCRKAYECIKTDLDEYADALLTATNAQWETTGVMVPFEQAMSEALGQASAGGGANPMSRYSRPQGVILQKALSAHMAGDFRDAAVRTGNNELMTAAAIAQAEQSQKSSWYTASELFKNMMGYVYLVLQAFIFAIIPIIIIALMIPGLGGKIFTNYFQILVWLTMWTPMLAIVNFLITVFGGAQLRETLAVSGLAMENSAVLTEYANNLVIAAQFIGTMVPLITWGLVKGAMAFTEFVSHGIGSSFATQAGAQAATGNVSMGNMSMDNTSMNKYGTTMSSSVGMQEVQMYNGAGKLVSTLQHGGTAETTSGKDSTPTVTQSETISANSSLSGMTQEQIAAQRQKVDNASEAYTLAKGANDAYSQALQMVSSQSNGQSVSDKLSTQEQKQIANALSELSKISETMSSNAAAKASVGVSGSSPKIGFIPSLELKAEASAGLSAMRQRAQDLSDSITNTMTEAAGRSKDYGTSASAGTSATDGTGHTMDASLRQAIDNGRSQVQSFSESLSETKSWVDQQQYALSQTYQRTQSIAGTDGRTGLGVDVRSEIAEAKNQVEGNRTSIHNDVGNVAGDVSDRLESGAAFLQTQENAVDAALQDRQAAAPTGMPDLARSTIDTQRVAIEGEVGSADQTFENASNRQKGEMDSFNEMGVVGSVAGKMADYGKDALGSVNILGGGK